MRIIPKNTRVRLEVFKGIGIMDMIVGLAGAGVFGLILNSGFKHGLLIGVIELVIFAAMLAPFEEDRIYTFCFKFLVYLVMQKKYTRGGKKGTDVTDITPFTGIADGFIEYGKNYYGIVVSMPHIEFRFMSERRQNEIIDSRLGAALRTVAGSDSAAFVKIDRPVIYDGLIASEERKLTAIKEAYVNATLTDEELTARASVIFDRIEALRDLNLNNKIVQPFHYLIFFGDDKNNLKQQAGNAVRLMSGAEMGCTILNDEELAVFLKYQYGCNFDEREVKSIPPEGYMDWILPKEIEVGSRYVKYDGLYTYNLRVTNYPVEVDNAWGAGIFNMWGTRAVLKLRPVDRSRAVRQIDRAINELSGQRNATGRASKLIELDNHITTLSELLSLLQGENEVLFETNMYFTVYDYTRTAVKKPVGDAAAAAAVDIYAEKKRVRRALSEENFRISDNFIRQFEAYASAFPSALDLNIDKNRGIHSSTIAALFPYVLKTLFDKDGVTIGSSGGVPVFINFFVRTKDRVNSNMMVIGRSGSGKSYAIKTILANLAAEDTKIFILDPENEYTVLAKNMRGKIIDVGSAVQGRLNPFHIITSLSDDEGLNAEQQAANISFSQHLQFLEEFFRQILQGLDFSAMEYLNTQILQLYNERGIDETTDLSTLKPSDFPNFDDLYDKLLLDYQATKGDYSKSNLKLLLTHIQKFSTGGRDAQLWNGEATITTDENFIVFNFQSMLANKNNTTANAQMLLVLKWLENEVIRNRDYNIKYNANRRMIIVIDEAHVFIDKKYPVALDFMFQMAKRIRKYNGMQIVITQNVKDFVGTEEIAAKSTAIINACQYSFILPLAPNDMHDLVNLYEKAGTINETEQEEIVSGGRGHAFAITSPNDRTSIDITATDDLRRIFGE